MVTPRETDRQFVEGLLGWSSDHLRDFAWRRPDNLTPYRVLVAELLLKRTTASSAAKVYGPFIERFPDLARLSASSYSELETAFSPLGLHKQRAKSSVAMADYLTTHHCSEIPSVLCELLNVPGIGQYSSRAVLSFGFDKPFAVVDGNVQRIFRRVYGSVSVAHGDTLSYQDLADYLLPNDMHKQFNFALIDLGSLVCKPRYPKCYECPVSNLCNYNMGVFEDNAGMSGAALRISQSRKGKGISQAELARSSGVSKMTIINLEKGRTHPRDDTVQRILRVLE